MKQKIDSIIDDKLTRTQLHQNFKTIKECLRELFDGLQVTDKNVDGLGELLDVEVTKDDE